jgi:hypothetical protein
LLTTYIFNIENSCLLGDLRHASRQKVRCRKVSSDHTLGLTHAAQAFANQFGEVGLNQRHLASYSINHTAFSFTF